MRKFSLVFVLLAALGLVLTSALPSSAQQKTLLQGWMEELRSIGKKPEAAKPAMKEKAKAKKPAKKKAAKKAAKKDTKKDTKKDAKKGAKKDKK